MATDIAGQGASRSFWCRKDRVMTMLHTLPPPARHGLITSLEVSERSRQDGCSAVPNQEEVR